VYGILLLTQLAIDAVKLTKITGVNEEVGKARCAYVDKAITGSRVGTAIWIEIVGHREDCPEHVWYNPTTDKVTYNEPKEGPPPDPNAGLVLATLVDSRLAGDGKSQCIYFSPLLVNHSSIVIDGPPSGCKQAIWLDLKEKTYRDVK